MDQSNIPLLFGLSGKGEAVELKHISDVKSGKACACRCPACGADLVAKKGKKMRHHFSHLFVAECPGGPETALHLFAKKLIADHRKVRLPPITAVGQEEALVTSRMAYFQTARPEAKINEHRVDILLESSSMNLAVEIKVNHAVDAYKTRRFIRSGQAAIEIDVQAIFRELTEIYGRPPEKAELAQVILYSEKHRKWLFNRRQHNYEYKLRKAATPRKVKIVSKPDYRHYWVTGCPDPERQKIKNLEQYRLIYARLHTDCLRCPHCREVEYVYEWIGYKRVPVRPLRVLCGRKG